jgi:hypothetical protein
VLIAVSNVVLVLDLLSRAFRFDRGAVTVA